MELPLIILGVIGLLLVLTNFDDLTLSAMKSMWGARILGGVSLVQAYRIYEDPTGNVYYFMGCLILFVFMFRHEGKSNASFQEFYAFETEEYHKEMGNK